MYISIKAKAADLNRSKRSDIQIDTDIVTNFFISADLMTIFTTGETLQLLESDYDIQTAYLELMKTISLKSSFNNSTGIDQSKKNLLPCPKCAWDVDLGKDTEGCWVGCKRCGIIATGLIDENSAVFHWNYMIAE